MAIRVSVEEQEDLPTVLVVIDSIELVRQEY